MIRLQIEQFSGFPYKAPEPEFYARLDRMFGRVFLRSETIPFTVREFVDATDAAELRYLPDGTTNPDKDYHFIKTDSTLNTVTIYPFGSQLVMATTSLVLTTRGDSAWLAFDKASQTWWLM